MSFYLSSCATLLTRRQSIVSIQPSETASYVIDGDTLINKSPEPITSVFRNSRKELEINLFTDSLSKTIYVHPIRSKFYYLNFISPYWGGFLIDELNTKKWVYPRRIYVDMKSGKYLPYFPMDTTRILGQPNRISVTPMAATGIQHPGIEAAYQRSLGVKHSIQFTYKHFISANSDLARNSKGFSLGFETKYYYRNTRNSRFYLSINLEHINKTHDAVLRYAEEGFNDEFYNEDAVFIYNLTNIHKKFYSLTPRFGIELFLTEKLVIDGYVGAGIRHRNVIHRNAPAGFEAFYGDWEWFDINYESNRATHSLGANLDLNFRIGWNFE